MKKEDSKDDKIVYSIDSFKKFLKDHSIEYSTISDYVVWKKCINIKIDKTKIDKITDCLKLDGKKFNNKKIVVLIKEIEDMDLEEEEEEEEEVEEV